MSGRVSRRVRVRSMVRGRVRTRGRGGVRLNQGWAMGPGSHGTAVPGRQSRAWDWDRD